MTAHPSTTFLLFRPARPLPHSRSPFLFPLIAPSDYDSHLRAVSPRRRSRKAPDAKRFRGPERRRRKLRNRYRPRLCASVSARARGLSRDNHTMRTRPGPGCARGHRGPSVVVRVGPGGYAVRIYCDRIEMPSARTEMRERGKERGRERGEGTYIITPKS